MHPIEISLREGFRDDDVVIRVDQAPASCLKAVTTKALVGLAQRQIVQATQLPATVEISLPRRGLLVAPDGSSYQINQEHHLAFDDAEETAGYDEVEKTGHPE